MCVWQETAQLYNLVKLCTNLDQILKGSLVFELFCIIYPDSQQKAGLVLTRLLQNGLSGQITHLAAGVVITLGQDHWPL